MGLSDTPEGRAEREERNLPGHEAEEEQASPPGGLFSGAPGFMTTRVDAVFNWARTNSLWPMPFGTACCAIEMMATAASRYDLARFGMERMSFSPRQADLLICAGRVSYKMAPVLRKIWEQMPQPKWSISMGACASSGGVFDVYSMVQGIDTIIPVDVYVPGCPPRPEGLMYGILMIQEKIRRSSPTGDWVVEENLPAQRSALPEEQVELITLPFGNSTTQNRPSGILPTGALTRPGDRKP
jgi:NADH-quinone oxidoreductase subunit B